MNLPLSPSPAGPPGKGSPTASRRTIPIAVAAPLTRGKTQATRIWWQAGFFLLFIIAPIFDLLRFDLTVGHAWLLGMEWRLGLDDFLAGRIGPFAAAIHVILRLFLPVLGGAALFLFVAWKWGRLYCGWLCPHFSVVETINRLMIRATGKPSVWETARITPWRPDGERWQPDPRWWGVVVPAALLFALLDRKSVV